MGIVPVRYRIWVLVAMLLVMVLGGAAVVFFTSTAAALTYVVSSDALSLDPLKGDDAISWKVITQVYEGLMWFRPNSTKVEPRLARDVEVSPDGVTYTFYLQHNVQFQDGTPFNADAVVWNAKRAMELRKQFYYADLVWGNVKEVVKLDDYTVKVVLNHPDTGFLTNLALPLGGGMVSPKAKDPSRHPVGTGPYRLRSWDKGHSLLLEFNDKWWLRTFSEPHYKLIRFVVESDFDKALSMLSKGKADLLGYVSPNQLPDLYKDSKFEVVSFAGLMVSYLGFNTKSPVFADTHVREAVALMLDKNAIVSHAYRGTAVVATGPLPPVLDREVGCGGLAPNPNRAVELLTAAGYSKEKPLKMLLEVPVEPRPYMSMGGKVLGEEIKKQLESSGLVSVQLLYTPVDQLIDDLRKGMPDAFVLGWSSDNAQIDNFLRPLFYSSSPLNFFKYENPQFDSYLNQALVALDTPRRRQLYKLACDSIMEDKPAVFLAYPYSYRVIRSDLSGFNANALEVEYLWLIKPTRL